MTAGWGSSLNVTHRAPGSPQARLAGAEIRIRELIQDAQEAAEDLRQVIAEGRAEAAAGFGWRSRRSFGLPAEMAWEEFAFDLREVCTRTLSILDAVADNWGGPNSGRLGAGSNPALIDEQAPAGKQEQGRVRLTKSVRDPAGQTEPGRKTPS